MIEWISRFKWLVSALSLTLHLEQLVNQLVISSIREEQQPEPPEAAVAEGTQMSVDVFSPSTSARIGWDLAALWTAAL